MTITVGTDSYVSVGDAEMYITTYIDSTFSVTDDEEFEIPLKQATLAIERIYGGRFIGTPTEPDQALHFPIDDATDIPAAVEQATSELAFLIANDEFDPYSQPGGAVKKRDVKVDVIDISLEYGDKAAASNPLYKIDLVLAPYLYSTSGIAYLDVVRG